MKALNIAVCAFGFLLSSTSSADLTRSTKDFALLDHTGKFHQLSYYGDQRGVFYTATGSNILARILTSIDSKSFNPNIVMIKLCFS